MSRVDMETVPLKHPRIMQIKTCGPAHLFCIALFAGRPAHPAAAPTRVSPPVHGVTVTCSPGNAQREPLGEPRERFPLFGFYSQRPLMRINIDTHLHGGLTLFQ